MNMCDLAILYQIQKHVKESTLKTLSKRFVIRRIRPLRGSHYATHFDEIFQFDFIGHLKYYFRSIPCSLRRMLNWQREAIRGPSALGRPPARLLSSRDPRKKVAVKVWKMGP